MNPLHFGPPPEKSGQQSGQSTPAHEIPWRLSETPNESWESSRWEGGRLNSDGSEGTEQLPQMAYHDGREDRGPPYSEDEDLQSPVVVSSHHRKKGSYQLGNHRGREGSVAGYFDERGVFAGVNGDGSQTYYIGEEREEANGPGGELVTYPPDHARHPMLFPSTYHGFQHSNPRYENHQNFDEPTEMDPTYEEGQGLQPESFYDNESRYSRDYQFTIASPDEEMHGKAVALFDFERENENELPLVEGQVILVSYRHGQGWLVAEDPKTGESGLVPEEYVRLLRDIEGGWSSLSGGVESVMGKDVDTDMLSPGAAPSGGDPLAMAGAALTPMSTDSGYGHSAQSSNGSNANAGTSSQLAGPGKRPSIVSTFSTSTKDLDPIPHHLLGTQAGQQPPQVVHYGSQTTTPTVSSPVVSATAALKRGANEEKNMERKGSRKGKR